MSLWREQFHQIMVFPFNNVDISDDPPDVYFDKIQKEQYADKAKVLAGMMRDHCLPGNFYQMKYDEFLQARRVLMAKVVRQTFESL